MGDRGAERSGRGALRVDVDPLVVAGGVGERVDPVLVHGEPVAGAQVRTDGGSQVVGAAEDVRHAETSMRARHAGDSGPLVTCRGSGTGAAGDVQHLARNE
jgi:hypothetical protein